MNESHKGLSHKYEVSRPELDLLAGFAQQKGYLPGSRMMAVVSVVEPLTW